MKRLFASLDFRMVLFAVVVVALFQFGLVDPVSAGMIGFAGATAFSKQELVFFDDLLAGFDDGLVLGRNVSVYNADPVVLERSQNLQIWRPQPYVSTSIDGAAGTDISASFADVTQLSVPIGIGFNKTVPWNMTTDDLNDPQQRDRKLKSAMSRLGSDINLAVANVVGQQGTLVVKQTSAASGYDDISLADALMLEQGLIAEDDPARRVCVLHARDYNKVAGNLAKPQSSANPKVNSAYERAYVGNVSGFETFKAGYTYNLAAKAGVTVTINDATAANRRYVPKATSTAATGETGNVDNRYMNLTIGVVSGTVKVGDRFTIAGVNAVHHITKVDTGQLKTFTITGIVSGAGGAGVVTISPPIIVADGTTQAEKEYANVTTTPANGAAITFLNTTTANVAPFWREDCIELLPGRNGFDSELMSNGAAAVQGTTELGIQIIMYRFFDINTKKIKYRVDTRFGVGMTQPEGCGILLFGQA